MSTQYFINILNGHKYTKYARKRMDLKIVNELNLHKTKILLETTFINYQ